MKTNERKSLHGKSREELQKELKSKLSELTKTRIERFEKQNKNTRLERVLRVDIARIRTVLQELTRQEKKV
ncbi:TPA: 50S ribosomal protein L29 [Patescibacteria group bacterium]|uniref:Large ribosomal subunit protein uL29 n=1 Tax=Candidatus Gottesmanbacteria bacterium GW2011_GWA1_43_11 TaxID=1618436 RepID=A0A0G1ENP6_9BACT|nr:MAG: hypothetical protein UV59_C0016G0024 [Candidatus Gottesmanbacteria bacterium GW2011_GWA1_43_11]HCS78460.1 50S ribosomal protein L29 [Patescibacteria group bacterium]